MDLILLAIPDINPETWAEAEKLNAEDLSDTESAEAAMGFYTIVLKKPGTTKQIVVMSRFAREFPNTIDKATTNLLKERKRRIKAEEKMAVLHRRASRLEEDLRHEKARPATTLLSTLGGSWRLASSPGLPLRTPPRRSKS